MKTYGFLGLSYNLGLDDDAYEVWHVNEPDILSDPSLVMAGDGVLLAAWTLQHGPQETRRVVCARSTNGGQTWTSAASIEADEDFREAHSVRLVRVPHSERVYAFYWYNEAGKDNPFAGTIFFRASDDAGRSWSDRWRVAVPEHRLDVPGGGFFGWLSGSPLLMPDGSLVLSFTKLGAQGRFRFGAHRPEAAPTQDHCEAFFLRIENLLGTEDPGELHFGVTPEGAVGLAVPNPEHERVSFAQHPHIALLPSGRMIATVATAAGTPFYAVSEDYALTWTPTRPLRSCPGGDLFPLEQGACPITADEDGRIYLVFLGRSGAGAKSNVYCCVGREVIGLGKNYAVEENNASMYFDLPRVLLDASASQDELDTPGELLHFGGRHFLLYTVSHRSIRIKEVPAEMLSGHGIPWAGGKVQTERKLTQTMRLPRQVTAARRPLPPNVGGAYVVDD